MTTLEEKLKALTEVGAEVVTPKAIEAMRDLIDKLRVDRTRAGGVQFSLAGMEVGFELAVSPDGRDWSGLLVFGEEP